MEDFQPVRSAEIICFHLPFHYISNIVNIQQSGLATGLARLLDILIIRNTDRKEEEEEEEEVC